MGELDALDYLTVFDYPTPLIAEVQDHINGGFGFMLQIPERTAKRAKRALKRAGVSSWGWMGKPLEPGIVFNVSEWEYNRALVALARAGVPVSGVT